MSKDPKIRLCDDAPGSSSSIRFVSMLGEMGEGL